MSQDLVDFGYTLAVTALSTLGPVLGRTLALGSTWSAPGINFVFWGVSTTLADSVSGRSAVQLLHKGLGIKGQADTTLGLLVLGQFVWILFVCSLYKRADYKPLSQSHLRGKQWFKALLKNCALGALGFTSVLPLPIAVLWN